MDDIYIERKICIGFITSTDYLQQIRDLWDPRWMESDTARLLTSWCVEYFDKYNKAPGRDIEGVYTEKLREGLPSDNGEWIEEILNSLSEEYRQTGTDPYQVDLAKKYFQERHLKLLVEDAGYELEKGNAPLAEEMLSGFTPLVQDDISTINPFSPAVRSRIEKAFAEREKPLIRFPKALGQFWNAELIRGGFVAIMGAEKRGKTFMLIDIALRGVRSGNKVAFFQAGDMTELQQLRRFGIYLAGRSDQERYCGPLWVPTADCLHHQLNECDREQREDDCGRIFDKPEDITYEGILSAVGQYPDHKPCYNCRWMKGSPWFEQRPAHQPLVWNDAYRHLRQFGKKYNAAFRMSTHANETLSVSGIKSYLSTWEKREGFIPDIVIIDYADILAADADISRLDFRHQQNRTWQRLRKLSEEHNCLVVTVTQIKATGYKKPLLTLDDFSEDKRKYAHVTAMYGLNQTPEEKRIGLMRINELVVREADFDSMRPVTILQRLQMGRPVLGSYW